jgi:hypothetical protein
MKFLHYHLSLLLVSSKRHPIVYHNFRGNSNLSYHHLPIGHLACCKVVFNLIKHPHFLHFCNLLLKAGHVLQIAKRSSISSLEVLGCLTSNRSLNSTSPLSFIYLVYHKISTVHLRTKLSLITNPYHLDYT